MNKARTEQQRDIDWSAQLEVALTLPGSVGATYSRFHNYSFGNVVRLYAQGVEPQPVATYKRWQELGRHVVKGAKAKEIIRPITVKLSELDDDGEPKQVIKFKPVRCIFPLCDTAGDDLPPVQLPEWDKERALKNLDITEVKFRDYNGNMQGYSYGRNIAVSEVAANRTKTLFHEIGHVVLGHTVEERVDEYRQHRGVAEFQAEGTAYLSLNELDKLDDRVASSSRAYIQDWLRDDQPSDKHIREVFNATDKILKAGRPEGVGQL